MGELNIVNPPTAHWNVPPTCINSLSIQLEHGGPADVAYTSPGTAECNDRLEEFIDSWPWLPAVRTMLSSAEYPG